MPAKNVAAIVSLDFFLRGTTLSPNQVTKLLSLLRALSLSLSPRMRLIRRIRLSGNIFVRYLHQ